MHLSINSNYDSINTWYLRTVIIRLEDNKSCEEGPLLRHLCIMGIGNDPMCRKCGTEEETSVHILCKREAFASLRYIYLGSFFLDPDDIKKTRRGGHLAFR